MNIDKFLGIVTNRLSFNYIAFQAVNLFFVVVAAALGTAQFSLLPKHDVVSLLYAFSIITSFYLVIFLLVTCVEFIYFFCKKQLPQKLFNKSLVLSHTLFTYVFYSILMFNCPDSDVLHSYGGDYLLLIFLILLYFAIIAFTVIPMGPHGCCGGIRVTKKYKACTHVLYEKYLGVLGYNISNTHIHLFNCTLFTV